MSFQRRLESRGKHGFRIKSGMTETVKAFVRHYTSMTDGEGLLNSAEVFAKLFGVKAHSIALSKSAGWAIASEASEVSLPFRTQRMRLGSRDT